MKGNGTELIKDIIVSILVVACIILILSVFLYDKISLRAVIPQVEAYELTDEMKKELKDTNLDDAQEVVVNYFIDASDLKTYEKTNSYVKGKSNPFAAEEYSDTNDTNSSNDNNTSDTTNSNPGHFYEDDGTK